MERRTLGLCVCVCVFMCVCVCVCGLLIKQCRMKKRLSAQVTKQEMCCSFQARTHSETVAQYDWFLYDAEG